VIANRADARGLELAAARGVATQVVEHRAFASREAFESALGREIERFTPRLVALAGFMRIFTPGFAARYEGRMLNIHPSLLPAFPGLDAQRQALNYGVRVSGATVHLVTGELDGGPIILQAAVPVLDGDSVESLSARILIEEHRLYPEAVSLVIKGGWSVEGRRFVRR